MEWIRIGVVRSARFRSGDGFVVYGDRGSGVVDEAHPLTPRRISLWDDAPRMAGHLADGHLANAHLDAVRSDGHLEGTHLADAHLRPAAMVTFETGPWVFGRFRHQVVIEDEAGNTNMPSADTHETVVNSDPPPVEDLRPVSFEAQTGRLTFQFTPSDQLTG